MACPVCFAPVESAVRESMNAGILVLLGVTVAVLGCFARFFVALAQRSRDAAHLVDPHAGRDFTPRPAGWHPTAQARGRHRARLRDGVEVCAAGTPREGPPYGLSESEA